MASFLNTENLPRGLRNNNVGNIIKTKLDWLGKVPHAYNTDKRFEQFIELKYGIRALFRDILNDVKKGQNTIYKLISSYAPPSENNTIAYISSVSKATGLAPHTKIKALDKTMLIALAKSITHIENFGGQNLKYSALVKDSDYEEAFAILNDTEVKKK